MEAFSVHKDHHTVFIAGVVNGLVPDPNALGARFDSGTNLEATHLVHEAVHDETLPRSVGSSNCNDFNLFVTGQ